MKTKKQVIAFLDSTVGKKVNTKSGKYNGQCVSLTKALFEFLGVPEPYKARGNAKDAGDRYLRDGIAKKGKGWLTVAVRRWGGGGYGHIWMDVRGVANYEQNGAKALRTTKNTRPLNQASQLINLDQWIAADVKPPSSPSGSTYTVRSGDTLSKIGRVLGMNWQDIAKLNGLSSPYRIYPGNKLKLPSGGKTYTVVRGDYLVKIGRKTNTNWATIARLNGITSPYIINPGQVLRLN